VARKWRLVSNITVTVGAKDTRVTNGDNYLRLHLFLTKKKHIIIEDMDTLLCNDDGTIINFTVPGATDEILAFHYGNFDNAYGDGTVGAAAANGRVYAQYNTSDTYPKSLGVLVHPVQLLDRRHIHGHHQQQV
jgi:hypothetical protein